MRVGCAVGGEIGSVHRSVAGSLNPRKINLLLYTTSQCLSQNVTLHPASHSTLMPISEAISSCGTMWPVSMVGRPGICMSHICVDLIFDPSGRLIVSGLNATRLL